MAQTVILGFEGKDGVSSPFTVQSAVKRSGRYALKYTGTTSAPSGNWIGSWPEATDCHWGSQGTRAMWTNGKGFFTGWVRVDAMSDVNAIILCASSGASTVAGTQNDSLFRVRLNTDGTLQLQAATSFSPVLTVVDLGSPSTAINDGAWHRIDLSVENCRDVDAGTCIGELKLDGTLVVRSTGLTVPTNTSGGAVRTSDAFGYFDQRFQTTSATVAATMYWDDLWASDTAYAPDDGGVTVMRVSGNGANVGWTGNDYTKIKDVPFDTTTELASSTSGQVSTFTCSLSGDAGGTVSAVKVMAVVKRVGATQAAAFVVLRSGGTNFNGLGHEGAITNDSTVYPNVIAGVWTVDPNTSSAWTLSALTSIEPGLSTGATATSGINWTSVWVEVWSSSPAFQAAEVLPPLPVSISPASGAKAGGTAVTISGSQFTGSTKVTIGGVDATSLVVVSDISITCTTAAIQKAGTYDVIVSNPDGVGILVKAYTFLPGSPNGNGGNNAAGGTTLVVSTPTSPAPTNGDIMYAIITAVGTTNTITQASWGTEIHSRSDGSLTVTRVFRKIAASEPASYTFTLGTTGKASGVIISVPADVDITTQQIASQANASSVNIAAPTLTPLRGGAVSIFAGGTATGTTVTPPTNYTEPAGADSASTGGAAGSRTTDEGAYRILTSLSATGTITGVAAAAATNVGVQILLDVPVPDSPPLSRSPMVSLVPQ